MRSAWHGPVLLAVREQPHNELLTLVWGLVFDRAHALGAGAPARTNGAGAARATAGGRPFRCPAHARPSGACADDPAPPRALCTARCNHPCTASCSSTTTNSSARRFTYFQRFELELVQALRPSAGLALLAQGGLTPPSST